MTLTYCTNIHPGESWAEIFAHVREYVPAVRGRFAPGGTFPVALRLSGRAAMEIDGPEAARFAEWCRRERCRVVTLNGFPHGRFHGVPVKEQVYLPDWRDPERLRYTSRLADLLASWLPEDGRGSISSVPIGFRRSLTPEAVAAARRNLRGALEHLERLAGETGREILLALEPEPGCLIETTEDVVRIFERLESPPRLSRHLGVCYDCCHQALQFEDPATSLETLRRAGIPIAHVQVSSALRVEGPDLAPVASFAEPTYLHQCVGRRPDGSLVRFDDLPEALAAAPSTGCAEWRVHFHVPVFHEGSGTFRTTNDFLAGILPLLEPATPLEVETYTWGVLPPRMRTPTVTESIVRELEWVARRVAAPAAARPEPLPDR
ncbi:MAG TPA: metabolite traffic protein EboE [bacterium]